MGRFRCTFWRGMRRGELERNSWKITRKSSFSSVGNTAATRRKSYRMNCQDKFGHDSRHKLMRSLLSKHEAPVCGRETQHAGGKFRIMPSIHARCNVEFSSSETANNIQRAQAERTVAARLVPDLIPETRKHAYVDEIQFNKNHHLHPCASSPLLFLLSLIFLSSVSPILSLFDASKNPVVRVIKKYYVRDVTRKKRVSQDRCLENHIPSICLASSVLGHSHPSCNIATTLFRFGGAVATMCQSARLRAV